MYTIEALALYLAMVHWSVPGQLALIRCLFSSRCLLRRSGLLLPPSPTWSELLFIRRIAFEIWHTNEQAKPYEVMRPQPKYDVSILPPAAVNDTRRARWRTRSTSSTTRILRKVSMPAGGGVVWGDVASDCLQ